MQEKRVFFTRMHPRRHAQEAIFPVIYSVFCTFPTPILTPKSLQIFSPKSSFYCNLHISNTQITLPPHPPHGSLCWAFLGSMLGHLGSILGPSWDYVGFCWVVLGLCWPSLGLCWAFLGSMLGHLGSVLAYLGACCAMQQLDSL